MSAIKRVPVEQSFQGIKRPQEPEQPYPYREEDVIFENKAANVRLAGTFTHPEGDSSATVILIAGYGRNDRNMTMMGHRYFLVLADYLTRQGIAVLRFDKRGVGSSTGDYGAATSEDFAQDVHAALDFLKTREDVQNGPLGLIGFSEGGLIASMVAAHSADVAFAVLMAPALITDVEYLVTQAGAQLQADGARDEFIRKDKDIRTAVYSIVKSEPDEKEAEKKLLLVLNEYLESLSEHEKEEGQTLPFAFTFEKVVPLIEVFNAPWYRFFLTYDTGTVLNRITIPVLVMNGDRDWIVSSNRVFSKIADHFDKRGIKNYTLVEVPGLNHLFQTCDTGSLKEYGVIEETLSPVALDILSQWIKARV